MSGEHKWRIAVICDPVDPAAFARLGPIERVEEVEHLVAGAPGRLPRVRAMRGPQCADCRVSLEDVQAMAATGKEWPCPGRRPDAIGGAIMETPDPDRLTRQQRRAEHRKAADVVRADKRRQREARAVIASKVAAFKDAAR